MLNLTRSGRAIAIIAVFCGGLVTFIWYSLSRQLESDRQSTISSAIQRNSNLAVALEQYAIRTIRNADVVLQLVKMEYEKEGFEVNIKGFLGKHNIDSTTFSGLAIINEKGKIVSTNIEFLGPEQSDLSDREHFRHHIPADDKKLFISKPVISRTVNKAVIILSRRINGPDGRFAGTVAVQIQPSVFTLFYADANLRDNDIISLISPDGTTYARRTGAVESYGENIIKSPLFIHVRNKPVDNYFAKDAIRGVPTYFSYRQLQQYPIIATVGSAEGDILANYYERASRDRMSAMALTALIVLFSFLVGFVLLHRKKNIEKIKESEFKYRSIFENSRDAILLLQPRGQMLAVNAAACNTFRVSRKEFCKKTFAELVDPTDPNYTQFRESMVTETSKQELRFLRDDGTSFIGEMASAFHEDSHGAVRSIIIIRDITERKYLAEKLLEEQQRFQRRITEQVIQAQEREREVIGRDLHDNVNQVLTTVKLYLEMALSNPESRELLISKSMNHVIDSINEIRNLSRDLSAPTLGTRSLVDSISGLLEMVQSSSGLSISFNHANYHAQLNMDQKLAIYRIAQEQLNNIIKHANATAVEVSLSYDSGYVVLAVRDNGKGFNPRSKRNGIGLNNIIGRARVFDGKAAIYSEPGKGCLLKVMFPAKCKDRESGVMATSGESGA